MVPDPGSNVRPFRRPGAPGSPAEARLALWDLPGGCLCPVIGTCLGIDALRRLLDALFEASSEASDFELHAGTVRECGSRNKLSERLQHALDALHAEAIEAHAGHGEQQLAAAWALAAAGGDELAATLWAIVTHPACSNALRERMLCELHMAQHDALAGRHRLVQAREHAVDENERLHAEVLAWRTRCEQLAAEAERLRTRPFGRGLKRAFRVAAALVAAASASTAASAQAVPAAPASAPAATPKPPEQTMPTITIRASADASAQGLSPAYPGGQVARGGRAGILGTRDNMETPFSITSYTNELIQDRQARSVGDVLQNDAGVRTARGFGNFQESYFIRGFILGSDDVAYNGLYSLLPRQYIATELFERVEVLHGASAFLSGANPGGGGIGGAINLLPKRAPNQDLTRGTLSIGSGSQLGASVDVARRFGPDGATGVRVNAAHRSGGTGVDDERARLDLLALGLDWHSRGVRLSGDIGWQDNRLKATRTNVSLSGVTEVPRVPDPSSNFAQPWSYSNERDLFGTLRGEWDLSAGVTAWAAYGLRRSSEANSLANLDVSNAQTGAASTYRFDNTRKDHVDTGELGLRGKLRTGPVGHEWVASASWFRLDKKNAYGFDFLHPLATNLYAPTAYAQPAFSADAFFGGSLDAPNRTGTTTLTSYAAADTLALLDDRLLVTLGLRHQKLDVANYAYGSAVLIDPEYAKSRVSPVAGAVYKLGSRVSLYANYIEGLTQGDTAAAGFGQPPLANQGEVLPPYVSKQKEVGAKLDLGTVGGGLALFSTTRPRSVVVGNVFQSSGSDRHQGAELSVFGRPAAGVRLLGGFTWLDAEQRSTGSAATDGKRVIGVPRTQASAGAELDVPFLPGLAVDARAVYTGARYADDLNTLRVPGWTRFDLGARYLVDVQGRLVTLRARVDNVADRAYWSSVGGYPGAGYLVVGAPRTFSLSASVDY